ncbi:efflux RND transporter periplasmic adaptor subunit [Vannielia litorea]|uniref:efflux RND transporter periplasmic adaptor subunit n=1 Tax=Vannielia litorea TaxID=1217970 RepID=UPI001C9767F1|nr:efflux RND transporter periplasmic adaptor subunit [Vannielia litorea]MBY6154660.1 efflux RND transporter periplasmic adaptor subunit [Vannielia litorea]
MTDDARGTEPDKLTFRDEPGSARSKWVAGLLALALVGWMGSGFILPSPEEAAPETVAAGEAVAVSVRSSRAEPVTKTFSAEGQAQPDRRALLRAQMAGEVVSLSAAKGEALEPGDEIARLSTRELEARVQEARQSLSRAQEDFDSTETLVERGAATAARLRETRAALAAAEAQLTQAEEAFESAVIRAPFAGRLDRLDLEIGAFTSAGAEVGTILDTDPLRIVIQVPQQALAQIREGLTASVTFITGEEREGEIEYISRDAETDTRTFRAEVTVPNPDGAIASGLSVQVRIPTGQVTAHFISPAILSLSEDGRLGVKTVGDGDVVAFHEVVVERAQRDGVWVSGLPERARIITIGQGFVSEGETVAPVADEDEVAAAEVEAPDTSAAETE